MFKKIVSILLIMLISSPLLLTALAHDDQSKHDADLKYALFGDTYYHLSGNQKIAFQAIADAAALSIDQFTPNNTAKWKKGVYERLQDNLQSLKLPKVSIPFDSIDLNSEKSRDGNITANTHRKYTHMGWDYRKYPNMDFWKIRKQLLLDVVNRILFYPNSFFAKLPWISDLLSTPNEQCTAFCAMVYYIHILGDHIEGDVPDKLQYLEPLIQYTSFTVPGIIPELKEYLQVVFLSQKSSWTFSALQMELTELTLEAERNCGTWGKVDTIERCQENQEYAKRFLVILSKYLPVLLKNESFFHDMFYSK